MSSLQQSFDELIECRGICRRLLPADAFGRDRSRRSGLRPWCKECFKSRKRGKPRGKKGRGRTNPIWSIPSNEFRSLVEQAGSLIEMCRVLGLRPSGSSHRITKQRCIEEGIDLAPLVERGRQASREASRRANTPWPLDQILTEHSRHLSGFVKKRLLAANMLAEKCALCGIGPLWNTKPLVLQLDHINGRNDDNRFMNLRLLCPNCHSQTETFTGRNNNGINFGSYKHHYKRDRTRFANAAVSSA